MEFVWKSLVFCVQDEKIYLKEFADVAENKARLPLVELQLSGRDHSGNVGSKAVRCSESESLRYVSHRMEENALAIIQKNDLCDCKRVLRRLTIRVRCKYIPK